MQHSQQQHRLSRIDQHIINRQSDKLYEPLRKSLIRNNNNQHSNMAYSQVSSHSRLTHSKVNELSASRVSRKMRSLSPEQVHKIKSNCFIPSNSKLIPTKNYSLIKNKRFEAIDVNERVYNPIPSIPKQFRSPKLINGQYFHNSIASSVQEIVYEIQRQPLTYSNSFTNRNNSSNSPHTHYVSSKAQYHVNGGQILNTSSLNTNYSYNQGSSNIYTANPTNNQQHQIRHTISPVTHNRLNNNNNITSFENVHHFNETNSTGRFLQAHQSPSKQPQVFRTSTVHDQQSRPQSYLQQPILHKPVTPSTVYSRASFQPNNSHNNNTRNSGNIYTQQQQQNSNYNNNHTRNTLNGAYDFRKSNVSTSTDYKSKKQQDFKYNLFSILDQPSNTKCKQTGCMKNQLVATKPKTHQWDKLSSSQESDYQ